MKMSTTEERQRKNSILDTFLKRNLKAHVYSDIRWNGSIVVRRDTAPSFQYLVVTGSEALLVDSPPRNLTTLFRIRNLSLVKLIHDLPDFLEGNQRLQTTHIILRVKDNAHFRTSRRRKSRRISIPGQGGSRRPSESSNEEADNGKISKSNSLKNGIFSNKSLLHKIFWTRSQLFNKPIRGNENAERDNERKNSSSCNQKSPPSSKRTSDDTSECDSEGLMSAPEEGENEVFSSSLFPPQSPLVRSISPSMTELLNRVTTQGYLHGLRTSTPELGGSLHYIPRSLSALESCQRASPLSLDVCQRSKSVLDEPGFDRKNLQNRSQSLIQVDKVDSPTDEDVIHIYTLSISTVLFHLLHNMWITSVLESTRSVSILSPRISLHNDQFKQTYQTTTRDLFQSSEVEQELPLWETISKLLCKFSSLRRTFWKDAELLHFIEARLKKYMDYGSPDHGDCQLREQQLEIVLTIFAILETSFSRSHGCPWKEKAVLSNHFLNDILRHTLRPPDLSPAMKLICKQWMTNFRDFSSLSWQLLPEEKLLKLFQEVILGSAGVAFYIIESLRELSRSKTETSSKLSHCSTRASNESPSFFPYEFVKHGSSVEGWLQYSVPQMLFMLQSKSPLQENAVILHYLLEVVTFLLQNDAKSLEFCKKHFSIEIRYYLNKETLKRCLSDQPALIPHTVRLSEATRDQILSKDRPK